MNIAVDFRKILKYKNEIAVGFIIVITLIIGYQINSSYAVKNQKLDKQIEELDSQKRLLNRFERTDKELQIAQETFFLKDLSSLRVMIEEIARKSSIEIKQMNPSKTSDEYFSVEEVNLSLDGSYPAFLRFIDALEQKNGRVESIMIRTDGQERETTVVVKGFEPKP